MTKITKDTVIGDTPDLDQSTAPFLLGIGMHCLGCLVSRGEPIQEACIVHGVDPDALVKELDACLSAK